MYSGERCGPSASGLIKSESVLSFIVCSYTNKTQTIFQKKSENCILDTFKTWATHSIFHQDVYSDDFSFKPVKVSVCYWKEKVPGQFSPTSFPCFLQYDKVKGQTFVIYGLPAQEYPGLVKVGHS